MSSSPGSSALLLVLWLAAPAGGESSPQEPSKREPTIRVESIRKHPSPEYDGQHLITLSGVADARDGTRLMVRVVPFTYRLAEDDRSFVPAPTTHKTLVCRARVGPDGHYTVSFATSRLHEHRIEVFRAPDADVPTGIRRGRAPVESTPEYAPAPFLAEEIAFFDVSLLEGRWKDAWRELKRHTRTIREFLEKVKPYSDAGDPVPMKLGRELVELETPIRFWTETTQFRISGSVLNGVMTDIGKTVPWSVEVEESADSSMDYGPPKRPPEERKTFDVMPWERRLEDSRGLFLREVLLSMAVPAKEILGKRKRDDRSAEVRRSLAILRHGLSALEQGELEGDCRAVEAVAEFRELLARAEAAYQEEEGASSSGLPGAEGGNLLRELAGITLKILGPAGAAKEPPDHEQHP